jgi:hypothetical protein
MGKTVHKCNANCNCAAAPLQCRGLILFVVPTNRRTIMTTTTAMNKIGFATVIASGLTAAGLGLAAPVEAAPAGPSNAEQTVSQLQAAGYHVIVNRIGSTPLDQATVVAVRPGQTYSRTDSGAPGGGNDIVTTVTNKTVYVEVK